MNKFQKTLAFQEKMKPAALAIYQMVFPGSQVEDLREDGVKVHVLDREFGIDALIRVPSGQAITLQEKYRRNYSLKWGEFTQEYMNAVGTKYESSGEWFKLGAQLYFYGWANKEETEFVRWFIMDITKYKLLVEENGGIERMGTLEQNDKHGRASFYAIPVERLESCIIHRSEDYS